MTTAIDDSEWHIWFAWHPVWCGGARVWWERIERRNVGACPFMYGDVWEYRKARS